MQGMGILFASIVAVCTTAAFKNLILRDVSYLDYVWRIELGLGVVPALLTVYLRKKLPETLHWTIDVAGDVAQAAADADAIGSTRPRAKEADEAGGGGLAGARSASLSARVRQPAVEPHEKNIESLKSIDKLKPSVGAPAEKFTSDGGLDDGGPSSIGLAEYLTMPSIAKNRNFSILVGTCMCWFLLSISFFSQNLFLPDVLKRSALRLFCSAAVFFSFSACLRPLSSHVFFSPLLFLDLSSRIRKAHIHSQGKIGFRGILLGILLSGSLRYNLSLGRRQHPRRDHRHRARILVHRSFHRQVGTRPDPVHGVRHDDGTPHHLGSGLPAARRPGDSDGQAE